MLRGRVFLTGGTGSLGTALLATAADEHWDCEFTVYSRDELKQSELRIKHPRHRFVLGDVRDYNWLAIAMAGHDVVVHAAANKQVPTAEVNAGEAIETNVFGSRNVARAAVANRIERVVGISSDKACAPVNCYGETKALLERLFQQASQWGNTQFNLVRYGNVLGSRGSVLPLFRKQATQGCITITDSKMTRFWLNMRDAISLVEQAAEETNFSTIVVPKCKASSVVLLAEVVAPQVRVQYIGMRPGEKMHEQLIHASEAYHTEDTGDSFRVWPAFDGVKGNVPEGFEYRSDTAPQLTLGELSAMVARA